MAWNLSAYDPEAICHPTVFSADSSYFGTSNDNPFSSNQFLFPQIIKCQYTTHSSYQDSIKASKAWKHYSPISSTANFSAFTQPDHFQAYLKVEFPPIAPTTLSAFTPQFLACPSPMVSKTMMQPKHLTGLSNLSFLMTDFQSHTMWIMFMKGNIGIQGPKLSQSHFPTFPIWQKVLLSIGFRMWATLSALFTRLYPLLLQALLPTPLPKMSPMRSFWAAYGFASLIGRLSKSQLTIIQNGGAHG